MLPASASFFCSFREKGHIACRLESNIVYVRLFFPVCGRLFHKKCDFGHIFRFFADFADFGRFCCTRCVYLYRELRGLQATKTAAAEQRKEVRNDEDQDERRAG